MTIPRGTPQPDGVFGRRVAAALTIKGVIAPDQVIIDAAERIVRAGARNGTLRLLTSEQFDPRELHAETLREVQMLLAFLARNGAIGIRLPHARHAEPGRSSRSAAGTGSASASDALSAAPTTSAHRACG